MIIQDEEGLQASVASAQAYVRVWYKLPSGLVHVAGRTCGQAFRVSGDGTRRPAAGVGFRTAGLECGREKIGRAHRETAGDGVSS